MKMKLKINASNKSNSSNTFKNKVRYVSDNLMSDPFFFIIFLSNFFLNIFMGFFHFFLLLKEVLIAINICWFEKNEDFGIINQSHEKNKEIWQKNNLI